MFLPDPQEEKEEEGVPRLTQLEKTETVLERVKDELEVMKLTRSREVAERETLEQNLMRSLYQMKTERDEMKLSPDQAFKTIDHMANIIKVLEEQEKLEKKKIHLIAKYTLLPSVMR